MSTPWQMASDARGSTDSERLLARLARKAFLSLWSYPNPYTDEGRAHGKGVGKELTDLLVVFGQNVLLFSDKHCAYPTHSDANIAWSRWFRRAVEKSARQLVGAEQFLKNHPGRVFLDARCTVPLPVQIPTGAEFFLIAVTGGSHEMARQHFGGESSGSFVLLNSLVGEQHWTHPFRIGSPLESQRFVHVLDEVTVELLLGELDTLPDLVSYLREKERFLAPGKTVVSVPGEEDLLARFICTYRDGRHALPELPANTCYAILPEGDWKHYSTSPQRAAKRKADERSYVWDNLIEYHAGFIKADTATGSASKGGIPGAPGTPPPAPVDHEMVMRAFAAESRFSRRFLGNKLSEVLMRKMEPNQRFARITFGPDHPERAYVFLAATRPAGSDYAEYRELRNRALWLYCMGARLKFPHVRECVGIATEPMPMRDFSSQDFLFVDVHEELDAEQTQLLHQALAEEGVLQSAKINSGDSEREFPMPFDPHHSPPSTHADGRPMNRKERRSAASRARKKPRPKA